MYRVYLYSLNIRKEICRQFLKFQRTGSIWRSFFGFFDKFLSFIFRTNPLFVKIPVTKPKNPCKYNYYLCDFVVRDIKTALLLFSNAFKEEFYPGKKVNKDRLYGVDRGHVVMTPRRRGQGSEKLTRNKVNCLFVQI